MLLTMVILNSLGFELFEKIKASSKDLPQDVYSKHQVADFTIFLHQTTLHIQWHRNVFSCSHMQVTLCQDIFVLNVPTKVIFRFQFGSLKVKWRTEDVIKNVICFKYHTDFFVFLFFSFKQYLHVALFVLAFTAQACARLPLTSTSTITFPRSINRRILIV